METRNEVQADCGCVLAKEANKDFKMLINCGKHIDDVVRHTEEFDKFRREMLVMYNKRFNEPPNVEVRCNLCDELILSHCMMSPDYSLQSSLNGSIISLRDHFKKKHDIDNPSDVSMCTFCHVISKFDKVTNKWGDCRHRVGQTSENE